MDNEEYIRVGTCYLKLCRVPTATGEFREKYLPWNIETIRQDHSKDFQYQEIRRLLLFSCPCGLSADVRQFPEYV